MGRFGLAWAFAAAVLLSGCGGESVNEPADECPADGTGYIEIHVSGLPDDVRPAYRLTGDTINGMFDTNDVVSDFMTGKYYVSAERVSDADPVAGTVYGPTVAPKEFCLEDSETEVVTVTYEAILATPR